MYLILTDQPGAKSWPITGASFILMHKVQEKPANAKEVLKFFDWSFQNGDQMAVGARLRADARRGREADPDAVEVAAARIAAGKPVY